MGDQGGIISALGLLVGELGRHRIGFCAGGNHRRLKGGDIIRQGGEIDIHEPDRITNPQVLATTLC